MQFRCCGMVAQTFRPDIGNAYAFGVSASGPRHPCDVGTQRVGRTEAGPLTDEHHCDASGERLADRIANGDAALLNYADGSEVPAIQLSKEGVKQRHRVAFNGKRRQSVGCHDRQIDILVRLRIEKASAGFIEGASEIGTLQIGLPVARRRVQAEHIRHAIDCGDRS